MVGTVLPAIKMRMPWMSGQELWIQQDGASPHMGKDNPQFIQQWLNRNCPKWRLATQPVQSPDLNVNDLASLFRSLKRRVSSRDVANIDVLQQVVKDEFNKYDSATLERCWRVLAQVYRLILENKGGNSWRLPSTRIRVGYRNGDPMERSVRPRLIRSCSQWLRQHTNEDGSVDVSGMG